MKLYVYIHCASKNCANLTMAFDSQCIYVQLYSSSYNDRNKEISNKEKTRMTNAAEVIRIYKKYIYIDCCLYRQTA